jgi:hypothetical protein
MFSKNNQCLDENRYHSTGKIHTNELVILFFDAGI